MDRSINRPKQIQACDTCRALKIRCDPSERGERQPCLRCMRSNTPCIFSPRQPRGKGRAQLEGRSPSFEKGIKVFRTSSSPSVPSPSSSSLEAFAVQDPEDIVTSGLAGEGNLPIGPYGHDLSRMLASHPFNYGALSEEAACRLLNIFINDCSPLYPVVQLPGLIDVSEMKARRPLLFKAAVGVAAMRLNPELAPAVQAQLTELYSASKASTASRSLDLLQALLVSCSFYLPPTDSKQKLQYCGKLLRPIFAVAADFDVAADQSSGSNESRLERLRAYLGCFLLAKELCMAKRKPSVLKYAGKVEYCVSELQRSEIKTPLDIKLLAQVELHRVAECVCFGVHYSEDGSLLDVSEEQAHGKIGQLCRLLDNWKKSTDPEIVNGPMMILYLYIAMYLYEPALFAEHRSTDFAAPYRLDRVELTRSFAPSNWKRWSLVIEHLIDAAHPLLLAFTKLDNDTIRCLPMVYWSALTYAAFILTKLKTTVNDPESRMAAMLDKRSVRAGSLINAVIDALQNAEAGGCAAVSKPFLQQLRDRHTGSAPMSTWQERGLQNSPQPSCAASLSSSVSSLDSFYQTSYQPQTPGFGSQYDVYQQPGGTGVDEAMNDLNFENMQDFGEGWATPQDWQQWQQEQYWSDQNQHQSEYDWHQHFSEGGQQ